MLVPVVVTAIGVAILLGTALGDRFSLPGPVLLVIAGAVLVVVPGLDGIGLRSEVVLFEFLSDPVT